MCVCVCVYLLPKYMVLIYFQFLCIKKVTIAFPFYMYPLPSIHHQRHKQQNNDSTKKHSYMSPFSAKVHFPPTLQFNFLYCQPKTTDVFAFHMWNECEVHCVQHKCAATTSVASSNNNCANKKKYDVDEKIAEHKILMQKHHR